MRPTLTLTSAGLAVAVALAGCANDPNSSLITSSVAKPKPAKVAIDPTCTALAAMITSARQEGTPARVRAVAANTNKSRTVNIKRASLAKVAELDKLNAEFQTKCSKYPGLQTANAQPAVAQPAAPTTSQPAIAQPVAVPQATPKPAQTATASTVQSIIPPPQQ